jgi:hypothetical protein
MIPDIEDRLERSCESCVFNKIDGDCPNIKVWSKRFSPSEHSFLECPVIENTECEYHFTESEIAELVVEYCKKEEELLNEAIIDLWLATRIRE